MKLAFGMLIALFVSGIAVEGKAQQVPAPAKSPSSDLPDGPVVNQNGKVEPGADVPVPKTGDILFAPTATPGPQTFTERTVSYIKEAYGPSGVFSPLIPATFRTMFPRNNFPREWRQGPGGFGRNYGDALVTDVTEKTARYVSAAALHEDFRYRPSASKSYVRRALHGVTYAIVDKSDSGSNRIALSNFAAAFAGAYVSNAYLPDGYSNATHADVRAASAFLGFAGQNVATEFSPELKAIAKKLHVPFPSETGSGWWTKNFGDDND